MTPNKSPAKNYGGSFFKSFRDRSAWDADEDEFGDRAYTTSTLKRDQSQSGLPTTAPTRPVSSSRSPSVGGSPKVLSGLAPIFHSGSPANTAGGSALLRSSRRDSLSAKDSDYECRSYIASKLKKTSMSSADASSPHLRAKHKRTVSWLDQSASGPANSPSLSSDVDLGVEQATHGSNDTHLPPSHHEADTESKSSGSTLSLNSPFDSKVSLIASPPALQLPQQFKNLTLAASRDLSPFKGKPLWEPDDDEWADVDAHYITETFKSSFKDPGCHSPRKAGALSGWGSTTTSFLPSSPTKRAQNHKLREEEDLRDKLEVLNNTYYCDPAGDLCDTIMQSVHLAGPGDLYFEPSTLPRRPHVIDLETYFKTPDPLLQAAKPRLCDAVATILSHTSTKCVEAFLGPGVEEFVYRRELERSKAGSILVVRRKGNMVIAGAYRNLGFTLQWTLYVKSYVSITGQWHETYANTHAGSTPIVNGVSMWDSFTPVDDGPTLSAPIQSLGLSNTKAPDSSPHKLVLSIQENRKQEYDKLGPRNPKLVLYQSRHLALFLLRDIWVRFDGLFECRATWEADGEVQSVRLKRGLVGFGEEGEGI